MMFLCLLAGCLAGCGPSAHTKWKRSLVVPDLVPVSLAERKVVYQYQCPPGYHIIACPTCSKTTYRTERRCHREFDYEKMRKVQKCQDHYIPTGRETFACAYCKGKPHICEPDSAPGYKAVLSSSPARGGNRAD